MRLAGLVFLLPCALCLRPVSAVTPVQWLPPPTQQLACESCSMPVPFNGYYTAGPYASYDAAVAAEADWSALTQVLGGVLSNVECSLCPIPMAGRCAKIGMTDGVGAPEYWIAKLDGEFVVMFKIDNQHAWACCEACDH